MKSPQGLYDDIICSKSYQFVFVEANFSAKLQQKLIIFQTPIAWTSLKLPTMLRVVLQSTHLCAGPSKSGQ